MVVARVVKQTADEVAVMAAAAVHAAMVGALVAVAAVAAAP